jgi:hypothetical protein
VRLTRELSLVVFVVFLLAACSTTTPTVDSGQATLPTPKVPSIAQIEAAQDQWTSSHTATYLIETTSRTPQVTQKIRVVVVEGQIRAAQTLAKESSNEWGQPESLPLSEARDYLVENLFERIRRDALGNGPTLFNLDVTFDPSLGYPAVIHADALPTRNPEGELVLNRQFSYELTNEIKILLEETFSPNREPILTLVRSGGPEAWCDKLRVFSNGSSVYTDECRREVLQLSLPDNQLEKLNLLRQSFGSLGDRTQSENQFQQLTIQGTGEGSPGRTVTQQAWEMADTAHALLSEPIGLGLTLVYTHNNKLQGFDTLNEVAQPARISSTGEIHAASLSPDNSRLAFSDDEGLKVMDLQTGNIKPLLPSPESGYYQPRGWSNTGFLLLTHIPGADNQPYSLGWLSIAEPSWHAIPTPEEVQGYGCDSGAAWSPINDQLAITGLGYDQSCNLNPGLTLVDITAGTAQRIVAPVISRDGGTENQIIAGAHTPTWSPDGEWIAFGLDQDASESLIFSTRLYRTHPDGSDLTPLTNNSQGVAAFPAWAPGGTIYYGLSGINVESDGIYQYNPVTNERGLVINGSELHPLSISPDGEFLVYEQAGGLYLWGFIRQSATEVVPPQEGEPASFVGWMSVKNNEQ